MGIVLSIFGVAFAAFCVWLTVRIVNRRELWAKWTLALTIFVTYPLSFGPACRMLDQRNGTPITYAGSIWGNDELLDLAYMPLQVADDIVPYAHNVIWWYGCLWLD